MKLLIISDSHGHIANLKVAMEAGIKANVTAVIHCGDWDNVETLDAARKYNLPIYSVLGNADVSEELIRDLPGECTKFDPFLLSLEFDGLKIAVTHDVNFKNPKLFDYKVVFYGHKHSAEQKIVNFTKFIRPGALINGLNFAIYETITGEVDFFKDEQI